MAPATTDFATIAAAALAAIGLIALALGLFRPRRVGTEPHCRKCAYDLRGTAIEPGARCSECGAALDLPIAVVIGRLRRRRWLIALGCVGLVVGGTGLAFTLGPALRKVNWCAMLPSTVLSRGVAQGDPCGFGLGAAQELERRLSADTLSAEDYGDLAQRCTDRLRAPTPSAAFEQTLLNILGALLDKDALSSAQRDEFLGNMVTGDLTAPPKLRFGPLELRVAGHWRGPERGLVGEIDIESVGNAALRSALLSPSGLDSEIDIESVGVAALRFALQQSRFVIQPGFPAMSLGMNTGWRVSGDQVNVLLRRSVYRIDDHFRRQAQIFSSTEQRLIKFERVAVDDIVADHSPSIPESPIRDLIHVEACLQRAYGVSGDYELQVTVCPIGSPQVNLAFHVFLETHKKRRALGDIHVAAGRGNISHGLSLDGLSNAEARRLDGKVTLVLTPSREVGLRSLDTDGIWPGELRFEDVPLNSPLKNLLPGMG